MNQFSKRAARRLIQRALVLVARDKHVRQHIREARMTTLWIIEDWNFAWTVVLDRGRIEFERRPSRRPDLTISWRSVDEFFRQVDDGVGAESAFDSQGVEEFRRFAEPLRKAFLLSLRHVLANPVDDAGVSLL